MPDGGSLAELRQVEVIRRLGLIGGNPHEDLGRLVQAGFTRPHAQRLLSIDRELKGTTPSARYVNPEEMLAQPLTMAMETALIPQKMLIAPIATLAQGGSIGQAALETFKAPITGGRTYAEIPGARETLGTGGVLALDMAADPIFFFSGGLRHTGRVGKALKALESARVQVSAGDFLAVAGEKTAKNVGRGTPVFRIREILDAPDQVVLKGRSPAATKKWIRNVEKAYEDFGDAWRKKGLGEPPEIDHVFVGPGAGASASKVPTPGELIRMGAAGIGTIKVPFAPEVTRFAPFQRAQARVADALEGTVAGKALGLDRQARFLREVASAAQAQKAVAQMHTTVVLDDMRRDLEALGVSPQDTAVLDARHLMDMRGILEAGGQERILAGRHADPSRLAEVHEMLYRAVAEGRKGTRLGRRKSQQWIERLGVLVEEDAELIQKHKALDMDMMDTPGVKAVAIDPKKAPNLDLEKINRWGKESRLKRFRELYERTVDPATGQGNFRRAYSGLQGEISGGIRKLVAEVFGLAPSDPVLKIADALEETYMRLGMSELTAGTLASFGKGYFPRAASPFAEQEIRRHLEDVGLAELKRRGVSSEVIQDFNTFLENSRSRGFAHLTQMQVEDLFRRGKLTELVGSRPSMENFARYAEQVGADQNPGIATFMDLFSGVRGKQSSIDRAFHRKLVRTDAQAANFYLSDPIAMAAKRWGTGVARIKAQEFTDSILEALAIEKLTQAPNEGLGQFAQRIEGVLDSYKQRELYQAVISTRKLPREAIEELKALGAELHEGVATLPRMSAELAAITQGVTKPRRWRLEATFLTKQQAALLARQSGRFAAPTELQGFWREIERLTSFWKQWALFPRPAYHARNFISNTWLMFQAGMPLHDIGLYYLKAGRLEAMVRKTTPTLEARAAGRFFTRGEVAALEGADNIAMPGFLNHPVLGPMSAEEVHLMRINSGVIDTGFLQSENARSLIQALEDAEFKKVTSPLSPKRLLSLGRRGTWMSAGQLAAKQIEGLSRTAMFLWAMERKGLGMSDSAALVFEHLFNYNDLHKWERQLRSTAIPFWSWIRNNVPRQLKNLVREPGKTLLPVKAVHSLRAQAEVSEELEPDFIEAATGWPIRTFTDARGRTQLEVGYLGTNFPIADLVDLGKAMGTFVGVPLAGLGVVSRAGRVRLSERETFRRGIAAVLQNVNPILTAPVEAAANVSFFRMKQIEQLPGGYVRIPWLDDYVTTPAMGQLLAMIPFLREVAGAALQTRDFRGNPVTIEDRISRLLTGSPKAFRQGPAGLLGIGGRLNVDVLDARTRAISREERGIEREGGHLRSLIERERLEASDLERFQEILRIRLGRLQTAAGATTGRL